MFAFGIIYYIICIECHLKPNASAVGNTWTCISDLSTLNPSKPYVHQRTHAPPLTHQTLRLPLKPLPVQHALDLPLPLRPRL